MLINTTRLHFEVIYAHVKHLKQYREVEDFRLQVNLWGLLSPKFLSPLKLSLLEISWSYINFSFLPSLFLGKAFSTFTLGGFDSMDKTSVNHKEYQSLLKLVAPAKRKRQRGKEKKKTRNTPTLELTLRKGTTVVVGKEDNLISGF